MRALKVTLTIAQRELASMFRVPAGWIIMALFAFLTGILFVNQTINPGNPGTLRYFFMYSGWLMIPIAPAISMRLMSEEFKSGSFESLRTAPAGDWSVMIGKYLGSLAYLGIMLIPSLLYPIILILISEPSPDLGPIGSGYLMLALVGMLYLAIGILASSLTSSQTLAFLGTMMSLILLMVLTSTIADQVSVELGITLKSFSITQRINELAKGIIDSATIFFFLIGTLWMITLATGVLEIRRLGKSKLRTAITGALFITITGICTLFAGSLTQSNHFRVDVTSTGDHKLSARSQGIVDRITDPTEIVLAVSMSTMDQRAFDLVSDVLDAYEQSSDLIRVRLIDLETLEGIEQSTQLVNELASRESSSIELNTNAFIESAKLMNELAPELNSLADALIKIRDSIDPSTETNTNNRNFFDQLTPIIRVYARDLDLQSNQITQELNTPNSISAEPTDELFPFDSFKPSLEKTLAKLMNQLDSLGNQVQSFAQAEELSPEPRMIARPIVSQIRTLRDQVAIAHDQINRVQPINAISVSRVLETGEALLVIAPPDDSNRPSIAAVDLNTLFLSSALVEQTGMSAAGIIAPQAQDLIAGAISHLVAPTQPILIYMHGGKQGDLLETTDIFTKTTQRLAQRGIDTIEWAAIEEPTPPNMDQIDPLGNRPIVFALISVDSTSQTDQSGLTGAKRATEMGQIVNRLIDQGESILISLNPSIFPTYEEPDPLAQSLAHFGIVPESGRTIMHNQIGQTGQRVADTRTLFTPNHDDTGSITQSESHPIANALNGLNTMLPWAIPMSFSDPENALSNDPTIEHWPLLVLNKSQETQATWAESDWTRHWSTPSQSRHLIPNQPRFNESKDLQSDSYMLAVAGQRIHAGTPQRIIAIGSNGWSSDTLTTNATQIIDGRVLSLFPGNQTLLDSSIAWLSGMDDLIGPGTHAKPIATITNISEQKQSTIRWLILAGVPGMILLCGMGYRFALG